MLARKKKKFVFPTLKNTRRKKFSERGRPMKNFFLLLLWSIGKKKYDFFSFSKSLSGLPEEENVFFFFFFGKKKKKIFSFSYVENRKKKNDFPVRKKYSSSPSLRGGLFIFIKIFIFLTGTRKKYN